MRRKRGHRCPRRCSYRRDAVGAVLVDFLSVDSRVYGFAVLDCERDSAAHALSVFHSKVVEAFLKQRAVHLEHNDVVVERHKVVDLAETQLAFMKVGSQTSGVCHSGVDFNARQPFADSQYGLRRLLSNLF